VLRAAIAVESGGERDYWGRVVALVESVEDASAAGLDG
jgi:hypothetical protein